MNRLPDFLIIGTARSGSTSMFKYLSQHPDINPPLRGKKEIHFFDYNYHRGTDWYRNCFPETDKLKFEATVDYLYEQESPFRVYKTLGFKKFIVILRNPVERTWSLFCNYWKPKRDTTLQNLYDMIDRVDGKTKEIKELPLRPGNKERLLHAGIYVRGVSRWMNVFGRENFLMLESQDFFANTCGTVEKTLEWLGINPDTSGINFQPHDPLKLATQKNPGMPADLKDKLIKFFKPYNEQLYELLGRDFEW